VSDREAWSVLPARSPTPWRCRYRVLEPLRAGATGENPRGHRRLCRRNNLGTTDILRNFAPLIRDNGRCWWWRAARAACAPWPRAARALRIFKRLMTLTAQCACGYCPSGTCGRTGLAGVDQYPLEDRSGSRRSVLAQQRRAEDLRRGILIAAISPGLIDTGASRQWLDMTGAPRLTRLRSVVGSCVGGDVRRSLLWRADKPRSRRAWAVPDTRAWI